MNQRLKDFFVSHIPILAILILIPMKFYTNNSFSKKLNITINIFVIIQGLVYIFKHKVAIRYHLSLWLKISLGLLWIGNGVYGLLKFFHVI